MLRNFAASPAVVGIVLLVLAVGCATSAPPQPTGTRAPTVASPPLATESAPTTAAPDSAGSSGSSSPVGSEVGDRVPDFTLNLADGSTVTSQQLLGEGQPTFLFFFTTW